MTDKTTDWLPPYEGNDMIGYMMESGFKLLGDDTPIRSMTNVRDTAIIVTDWAIWRARPSALIGFCIELVAVF